MRQCPGGKSVNQSSLCVSRSMPTERNLKVTRALKGSLRAECLDSFAILNGESGIFGEVNPGFAVTLLNVVDLEHLADARLFLDTQWVVVTFFRHHFVST